MPFNWLKFGFSRLGHGYNKPYFIIVSSFIFLVPTVHLYHPVQQICWTVWYRFQVNCTSEIINSLSASDQPRNFTSIFVVLNISFLLMMQITCLSYCVLMFYSFFFNFLELKKLLLVWQVRPWWLIGSGLRWSGWGPSFDPRKKPPMKDNVPSDWLKQYLNVFLEAL